MIDPHNLAGTFSFYADIHGARFFLEGNAYRLRRDDGTYDLARDVVAFTQVEIVTDGGHARLPDIILNSYPMIATRYTWRSILEAYALSRCEWKEVDSSGDA